MSSNNLKRHCYIKHLISYQFGFTELCNVLLRVLLLTPWQLSYGESLWPGTNLTPGENRSGQLDQARLSRWVGGWVAKRLFAFAASSLRVMGWNRSRFFLTVICIMTVCKLSFHIELNYEAALLIATCWFHVAPG